MNACIDRVEGFRENCALSQSRYGSRRLPLTPPQTVRSSAQMSRTVIEPHGGTKLPSCMLNILRIRLQTLLKLYLSLKFRGLLDAKTVLEDFLNIL